ncbi:MAG: hypothetical protein J7494_08720 [Sphingobium sp.]|nr:hypothetical protein [Sphingobium sp.]
MSVFLLLAAAVSADGPDLAAIDRAVAKCDAKVMTSTFADEPQRRRAFAIAAFNEQQEIVAARRELAARRMPSPGAAPLPAAAPVGATDERAELDHQAHQLADRQQALDDTRMLSAMRDQVLDLMRQQYLSKCSGARP